MKSTAVAIYDHGQEVSRLDRLHQAAMDFADQAIAANTKRAYRAAWADFASWCGAAGLRALPADPTTVGLYLADRAAKLKTSTLQLRLSAITQAHRLAGHELDTRDPRIAQVWKGIKRSKGTAPKGKVPIVTADLRRMVAALPESLLGIRDRAILLLGFAAACRRSELVAFDVEDVTLTSAGLVIAVRRSKTDQDGRGSMKGVPHGNHSETCPVRAYLAWLEAAKIETGPVFRSINRHGRIGDRLSDKSVALVVKRTAKAAGLDPTKVSGHSLRAGLATAAAAAGVSTFSIMDQTGHKKVETTRAYIRLGSLFTDNVAARVGL